MFRSKIQNYLFNIFSSKITVIVIGSSESSKRTVFATINVALISFY